jgi:hypothetical protein
MQDAIKQENRLTKMEERLKTIEDKVDKLPDLIMERFEAKVMLIKQEAIREAMLEDEKVFVKRSDVEFLEKIVCDVVSKQVGKWFITKVVVSTAVIVAVIQYIISLYK